MTSLFGHPDNGSPLFSSNEEDDGVEESGFEDNVNTPLLPSVSHDPSDLLKQLQADGKTNTGMPCNRC